MNTITKIFHFEAAHYLPDHQGKCRNTHGHSYKLEVTVEGSIKLEGAESGMVMDFGRLKEIVNKEIVSLVDHTMLNASVWKTFLPPTAENLCNFFAAKLLSYELPIIHIRLWETVDSHADWWNMSYFGRR